MKTAKEILKEFTSSLKNYSTSSVDTGLGFERKWSLTEQQLYDLIECAKSHQEELSQPSEVSDEGIEKWARTQTNDAGEQLLYFWGAKAMRDGKIKKG